MEIRVLGPDAAGGLAADVARLVNAVYATAEKGIWRDGTPRTSEREMAGFIGAGEIVVARLGGRLVGAVRVQRFADGVGEFGMLAAADDHRGLGIGRELVRLAERVTRERGLVTMRLELLVPQRRTHPGKQFLHEWYTRIGYRQVRTGGVEEQYPQLAPRLAMPCDFVIYHKDLG